MKPSIPIFCLLLLSGGCKEQVLYKTEYARKIEINVAGEDVKIPSDVWNLIEEKEIKESQKITSVDSSSGNSGHAGSISKSKDQEAHGKTPEHPTEGATTTSSLTQAGTNFDFVPVKVYLTEKNKGVLREPAFEISLPRGGGKIDLSEYTTGVIGTFFVALEMELPEGVTAPSTVHFVSHSRQRRVDGKIIGSGCDVFMDIKDFFLKSQNASGVIVNTNRNRHLSVLGGTFVMSAKGEHDTAITQVTFTDTKLPEYFCEFVEGNKSTSHANEHEDELELPQ